MHGEAAKRRSLGFRHLICGPDARDFSGIPLELSLPSNGLPLSTPLSSSLIGNGANENAQSTALPDPPPASISDSGSSSSGGNIPTVTTLPTSDEVTATLSGSAGTWGSPGLSTSPVLSGTTVPGAVPTAPSSGDSGSQSADNSVGGSTPGYSGTTGSEDGTVIQISSGFLTTTFAFLNTAVSGAVATDFPSTLQPSQGSGYGISGTSSSSPATTIATSREHLSRGAIAGIIFVCLFSLLVLILLALRRRSIAHRVELRRQWWFSNNVRGSFSAATNENSRLRLHGTPFSRSSSRSSFATHFDQGLLFQVNSPSGLSSGPVPDLPPMAEVCDRNSVLISTGSAVARRESLNAMLSNDGKLDAHSQHLFVPAGRNNGEPSIHMSVRPFSPSESFAFPKPPRPAVQTSDSFPFSKALEPKSSQSFTPTLVNLCMPPRAFMTDDPPETISTLPLHPETSTPSLALSQFIAVSNPSIDPFVDPEKTELADVEVIHRPFTPTLDDELAIRAGDSVRLLQIYDDGWVFVERLAGVEGARNEYGLIPIDCLRDSGKSFPASIASKRVSSYSDHGPAELVGTAL